MYTLKRILSSILIVIVLSFQLPIQAWAVTASSERTSASPLYSTVGALPQWFLASSTASFVPRHQVMVLTSKGVSATLPVGISGFSIDIKPLDKSAEEVQISIDSLSDSFIESRSKYNVTFYGHPFRIIPRDARNGEVISSFGFKLAEDNLGYESTISTSIHYDNRIFAVLNKPELSYNLALYVYDGADGEWRRLVSYADTERDVLYVDLNNGMGNIFRLGILDSLPTIMLDPDSDVAHVTSPSSYAIREGSLNVDTARDVQDYISKTAAGCGGIITVSLTHEDPHATSASLTKRTNLILDALPDAALVIAYDSHASQMAWGTGGMKLLFVDVGKNRSLASTVVGKMRSFYNHTHGNSSGLYEYPYYIGSYPMHSSVERKVANHTSSIPIARVEVGLLSLYQNRAAIDQDFHLPEGERRIPRTIGQALLSFLDMKIGCASCSATGEFKVRNNNYHNTEAAKCVVKKLLQPKTLSHDAKFNSSFGRAFLEGVELSSTVDFCGLKMIGVISSNPPIPVFMEHTPDGKDTIVLPTQLNIGSLVLETMGAITKVAVLDYSEYYSGVNNEITVSDTRLISTALSVGACEGLMAWLARRCAGLEPLSLFGVGAVSELTEENQAFLEEILWYQLMQLTRQYDEAIKAWTPMEMYQTLGEGGSQDLTLPRIATFVPSTKSVHCGAGAVPVGHTLFIVGASKQGDNYIFSAFDPNTLKHVQIFIDETTNEWIYRNPPYPADDGSSEWRGRVIYAVSPDAIAPYPTNWHEKLSVEFLSADEILASAGTYGHRPFGGFAHRLLGGDTIDSNGCVSITRAGGIQSAMFSGLQRYPDVHRVIKLRGVQTSDANLAAETFMEKSGSIILVGEATTATVDTVGIYPSLSGITITTNMSEKRQGVSFYRVVDNGETNRIFNVRDTTIHQDEQIGVFASPHNNLFIFDNSQSGDRPIDLMISTVGRPGVTTFFTNGMEIAAGHIVTFTVWNWDNISDSLIFAYDWDGYARSAKLLQDVVRPTQITFGAPSYLSGTVTYLTPQTSIAFDVMPATCGVSATLYRIDDGAYQVYTHSFSLADLEMGEHTIEYYSVDNIGNTEPVNVAHVYLYNEPPLATITLQGELGDDGWYTPPVTITLLMTPTVLPVDYGAVVCQALPGVEQEYQGAFAVDESATGVVCTVVDVAGLIVKVKRGIPIRTAHRQTLNQRLGESSLLETERQGKYQKIFSQLYSYPGAVLQSLRDGTCRDIPVSPGNILLLESPFLGNPLEHSAWCSDVPMRAEYGRKVLIFSSVISKAEAVWESPVTKEVLRDYLGLGSSQVQLVTEDDIREGVLDSTSVLVIPAIRDAYVLSITQNLATAGLEHLRSFVNNGGYVYASGGVAASLLISAGVISSGTVSTKRLIAVNDRSLVAGANDSPLGLNWITPTVYVPAGDFVLSATSGLTSVAVYSGTNSPGSPAILKGAVGKGHVVIANHHPLVAGDPRLYPPFIDVLLDAMAAPAALLGQGQQSYSAVAPYDLLPAYKAGIPMSLTVGIDYLSSETGTLGTLIVALSPGFYARADENPGWHIVPTGTMSMGMMLVKTISGTERLGYGRHLYLLLVRTNSTDTLNAGVTEVGTAIATIYDGAGREYSLKSAPMVMRSAASPDLMWYSRLTKDVLYGLVGHHDNRVEALVGAVNLQDNPAYRIVYTTVLPLLTPVMDMNMHDVVTDAHGETVWLYTDPVFNSAPLPDQAWYPGQSFGIVNWDGHTVMTMALPADSPIKLPLQLLGNGCDSLDGTPCCEGDTGEASVGVVHSPTRTLVTIPAMIFTWHLGDINGYEYRDPVVHYQMNLHEIHNRRVDFMVNYDPYDPSSFSDTNIVFLQSDGAVWASGGKAPLTLNGQVLGSVPESPVTPTAQAMDLWERSHRYEDWAKRIFLVSPSPETGGEGKGASAINITSEAWGDTNGDGVVEELRDIPADRPVTVCLHTVLVDDGRQDGKEGTLVLRLPVGLGYNLSPLHQDWAQAYSTAHGYAVYSDTKQVEGEYWNIYRVSLPEKQTETLTTCVVLSPYPNIHHEGYRTFLNGAFYYYPNGTTGAWPFALESVFVQSAWAVANNVRLVPLVSPWRLGRGENHIIYGVDITDTEEPHTVYPLIYVATYGGADYGATVYVGGSENNGMLKNTILQGYKDTALIRVEIHNNTGVEWEHLMVTATYPGLLIEPYTPTPDDMMALTEQPHLQLDTLGGVSWGVYYFRVRLDPTYSLTRGEMLQVPIVVTGNNLPGGFDVPVARIGVADEHATSVNDVLGIASGLRFAAILSSDVISISEARIVPHNEFEKLRVITGAAGLEQWYTSFPTVPFQILTTTDQSMLLVGYPPLSNTLPARKGSYAIVLSGTVGPLSSEVKDLILDANPTAIFTNAFGISATAMISSIVLPVRGPYLKIHYHGLPCNTSVLSSTVRATVENTGEYLAINPSVALSFSTAVSITALGDHCQSPVVLTDTQIMTCEVHDLIPGGKDDQSVRFIVSTTRRSMPNVLVGESRAVYVNSFTNLTETMPLQSAWIGAPIYFPLVLKQYFVAPNLIVEKVEVSPAEPSIGEHAVITMVIRNIGSEAVSTPFWIDLFIDPDHVPHVNDADPIIGMAWEVVTNGMRLSPGQSITVTTDHPQKDFDRWQKSFTHTGHVQIYVLVDSQDDPDKSDPRGNIYESNENDNLKHITVNVNATDLSNNLNLSKLLPVFGLFARLSHR